MCPVTTGYLGILILRWQQFFKKIVKINLLILYPLNIFSLIATLFTQ